VLTCERGHLKEEVTRRYMGRVSLPVKDKFIDLLLAEADYN